MNIDYRKNSGFTLVELVMAMALSLIIILGVSSILVSGVTSFDKLWNYINREASVDSDVFTIKFGAIGRKSNRSHYTLYKVNNGTYTEAKPVGSPNASPPEQIVTGEAVEFIYWDVPLDATDSYGLMDTTKFGTASALFYVDGNDLKIDYNQTLSAISGGTRKTPDSTEVLVRNIDWAEFSHSTVNEQGQGCVRVNLHITDEYGHDTAILKSAVYPRNVWPK